MRQPRSLVSYHLTLLAACSVAGVGLSACSSTRTTAPAAYTAIVNGQEQPAPALAMGSPATVRRILDEGKNRNQVMAHLTHLSNQIGPRLTGSTACDKANAWCADQFRAWGLTNVHQHEWGQIPLRFDRGPSTGRVITFTRRGRDEKPEERVLREMELTTLAWTGGTDGPVRGPVVRMPDTDEEFDAVKDKLAGAWVLIAPPPQGGRQGIRAVGGGMNDRTLVRWAIQTGQSLEDLKVPERDRAELETLMPMYRRLKEAGIAGYISPSRDERVWTGGFRRFRDLTPGNQPKDVEVSIRLSDYDCINSRLTDGDEFVVEFDLKNQFTPGPFPMYNTVADIRGTEKPDEYIIVSAHLDSWDGPGSQGTTDNGTGSSVTLEAARILMASGAKPKRTIRFILWTGEEQGLLGSRKWVEDHESIWPRISACFVDDGGTNYQGGLKCTDAMGPILAAATAPVNDQFFDSADGKPLRVNIQAEGERMPRSGGGSDHASFLAKGIPGFFWDEVGRAEYGYGWHTQNDKLGLAIPEYLMQSATCAAITAYNLACADELLPRFPMDPPESREGDGRERRRGGEAPTGRDPVPPTSPGDRPVPAGAAGGSGSNN